MREPSDSADRAAAIFDRLGVRWALIGALAAQRYRLTPRLTTDADFLAERADGLEAAFRDAGYNVDARSTAGEAAHMLVVRGMGDQIDVLFPVGELGPANLIDVASTTTSMVDALRELASTWTVPLHRVTSSTKSWPAFARRRGWAFRGCRRWR